MASSMADAIEILIVPNLKTKGVEKQTQEITKIIEKNIGKPLDSSLERYFQNINGQLVTFVKTGNKYKRLSLDIDKKKNITGISGFGGSYSKSDATRLFKAQVRQEEVRIKELEAVKKQRQKATMQNRAKERGKEFASIIGDTLTGKERLRFNISQQKEALKSLEEEFASVDKRSKKYKELQEQIKSTQLTINSLNKSLAKEVKVGPIERLINTFKRVGFYRIARGVLSKIGQGFSESIQNIAKFDSSFNDTMSSITSSFTMLSNSVATIFVPILQLVEPMLRGIAQTVAEVSNSFSYLIAKLTGSSTYLKVNTEYMKDFNKEMNKFSFDKFEALNPEDNSSSMFTKGDVSEGLSDGMRDALAVLTEIGGLLLAIGSYKFVTWITDGSAKKFFGDAKDGLKGIKEKIDNISSAGLIASSAFAFVTSIINLINVIKNWDSQSLVTKISAIVSVALALFAVVASIVSAILPVGGAQRVWKAIAIGTTAGATLSGAISVMKFENGGRPDAGSLFIAGEAGAELVTTMPSGQTGVTNIAQFKQAQLEALSEWWDYAKYDLPEGASLSLDGAVIARSKNFKAELNRTNSGLNLR